MSEFKLPDIPNDYLTGQPFVGAINPSLFQLNDYITRKFKHDFVGINTIALKEYMATTQSSWSMGKYYLFGQLHTDMNAPITCELLQEAIDLNARRRIEYGVPCNALEVHSIAYSESVFRNLIELLQKYYQHPYDLMEMYKPGGNFMTNLAKEWCS
jgi:hypothetical protein